MQTVLVWHRADLRTADNAALAAAVADDDTRPVPAFVFDPAYYGEDALACDARRRFLHESLRDLRRQYRDLGSDLTLLHGDPRERLRDLLDDGPVDRIRVNRDVTARGGRERDRAIGAWDAVEWFADDGIVRPAPDRRDADGGVRVDTRDGWQDQCESYFEADPHPRPDALPSNPIESDVTIAAVEDRYDVTPEKRAVPEGGTVAGNDRLSTFLDRIADYPSSVSPPAAAEDGASRLSPYLKFGCLSPRQVYHALQDGPDCRGKSMFESRLFWNRHYTQKLADWPGWTERSVNPVFRSFRRAEHDHDLVAAWQEGRTGFPMVDAAMRALVETGFLNFRMRAMVASFFTYVLREWWKRGADFMYRHLIDADPAINYTQWQSQAGLVGVHPIRVYDPAKQVREYDPDGEFVREYVPELAPLPDEHLARPEKAPLAVQAECGVEVGADYPYPIIDFEARAERAREEMARLDDRAKEAIYEADRVRRRASLSRRGRGRTVEKDDATANGQARLSDYSS
jgi:deoxyribodipyrimidine photo-lyase